MTGDLEPPTRRTESETTTDSPPANPIEARPFPYASGLDPATRALPRPAARFVLEAGDEPPTDAADGHSDAIRDADAGEASGSTTCPDCGGETANGAGLFTCLACPWTGVLR